MRECVGGERFFCMVRITFFMIWEKSSRQKSHLDGYSKIEGKVRTGYYKGKVRKKGVVEVKS